MSFLFSTRTLLRGTLAASSAGALTLGISVKRNPESGFARSMQFWGGVMPVYAHYKYVEWSNRNNPDADVVYEQYYQPLNDRYAPIIEQLTLKLQGFYYKLAQVVSTRDEFLPEQYMKWAKRLQDQSPAILPSDQIRAVVSEALGRPLEEVFDNWEDKPVGAASIGQVHRAVLKDTGEVVAVKIQYPGVEDKFRADIATVEKFCEWLMPQNAPFFREIKKQFATEFDYEGEAKNLEEVRSNLINSKWKDVVEVPRPISKLCSKNVLVMTYLPGDRLVDGVRAQYRRLAEKQGKSFEKMEEEQKKAIAEGRIQRKEIGESAREIERIGWMIGLRDTVINSIIWIGNWTVKPVLGGEPWQYVYSERPINLGKVLDTLLRVHAYEIFHDGAFNADCHPGNVLLMPDGRLGLIDYGQCKRMALSDRIIYAKLILALHRDNEQEVVRIMTEEIGFRTRNMNADVIFRTGAFWNDRDTADITRGMNVHKFMEYLEETDPPTNVNDEFIMVGRVSVLLRGVANAFGMRLRVSDYWAEEAQSFLKAHGVEY